MNGPIARWGIIGPFVLVAAMLASCASGGAIDGPAEPSDAATNEVRDSTAEACAGMTPIVTSLFGAAQLAAAGEFAESDVDVASRLASIQLFALAAQPGIGLKPQIEALIAAESPEPVPPTGAAFDAERTEFQDALGVIREACAANGTDLIVWSAVEGG